VVATVALAVAASIWIFLAVDAGWHSVSDTLWLTALAVLAIVRRTMTSP